MRGISVDAQRQVARAQSGVLLGELDRATQAAGLATTLGTVTDTGIAGLTLGGGMGRLMRKHGLACDNLRSVDVVTADGKEIKGVTLNEDSFSVQIMDTSEQIHLLEKGKLKSFQKTRQSTMPTGR